MHKHSIVSDPDLPPGVLDALRRGQKIEAIKRLRESLNLDLKSAKEIIERYERTHAVPKHESVRGMITEDRTNSRLLWIAVVIAVAAAVYFFYFK
jgi:hypothetical protein